MPRRGKRYKDAKAKLSVGDKLPPQDAIQTVKDLSFAKFDETVDVAVNLGVNPKYSDQMVRGAVVLPHGTGKTNRVLVFAKGEKVAEAEEAGADFVGGDDLGIVARLEPGAQALVTTPGATKFYRSAGPLARHFRRPLHGFEGHVFRA